MQLNGNLLGRLRPGLRNAAAALRLGLAARRRSAAAVPVSDSRPYAWEASYPPEIAWDFAFEPRPLHTLVDEAAEAFGTRPGFAFLGKRTSYGKLRELVDRAAEGLRRIGVGEGTRVGLFLPNCPYYVIAYFAVLKAGGTVVNFNPLLAEPEIVGQIAQSDTTILVTLDVAAIYDKVAGRLDDTGLEKIVVCRLGRAMPLAKRALFALMRRREVASVRRDASHLHFEDLLSHGPIAEPAPCDPVRDVAVLQFTGGTTGTSKAAMLTHAALLANALQIGRWVENLTSDGERMVGVLPLFHVFGMTGVMNLGLHKGIEVILQPRYRTRDVLMAIARERASVFVGVPTMFSAMVADRESRKHDLSSLKYCVSGGAPLPLEVKRTFEELTGCTLVEGYGLTEAGPVVTVGPLTAPGKPGSAGLPLPGTRVEIRALEDPQRRLAPGEAGEICVAGPQLMSGYWHNPAETAAVLREGWLFTGDVGTLDEDGYLFVVDRIKDLILNGGYNVYPRVVEEALYRHPAVAEAVVAGIPDEHRGEIVKAFVRRRAEATVSAGELRAFLKQQLASYEVPREIEFRDELPRTLIGKPSRRDLLAEELRRRNKAAKKARSDGREPQR